MLDEIHAANIGLIANATMTPGPGLTVITGETGTGKTLMLGALRLIRGDMASRDVIGPHSASAEVAARFVAHDGTETVVRRTVGSGRSRAYVDGVPVTAGELATVIGPTVSIVSQHDQHTLTTSDGVRTVVDAMFTRDDAAIFDEYRRAYIAFGEILDEMTALGSDQRGLQRERDVLRFQIDEIETAGFRSGDEETLRHDLERLRHVEELSSDVTCALDALGESGIDEPLARALGAVQRIARMDPMATTIVSTLTDAADQLREATAELSRYGETLDVAPEALSVAEARLAELSGLKRKYGDSIDEIERFAKDAAARAEQIDALIESAAGIEQRHREAIDSLDASALALRAVRTRHADRVSELAQGHLEDLGFSDPVVRIEIRDKEPTVTGADALRIMFASDAALSPAPLSAVASGGELSRLVLALTLASKGAESAVVVFDEIDAGIGGSTALAMGEKLASLATGRQVICVTHLPQVAAFGETHFVVERTRTHTEIREATGAARVEEIARMLAGLADSDKGKEHAEELLSLAGRRTPLE